MPAGAARGAWAVVDKRALTNVSLLVVTFLSVSLLTGTLLTAVPAKENWGAPKGERLQDTWLTLEVTRGKLAGDWNARVPPGGLTAKDASVYRAWSELTIGDLCLLCTDPVTLTLQVTPTDSRLGPGYARERDLGSISSVFATTRTLQFYFPKVQPGEYEASASLTTPSEHIAAFQLGAFTIIDSTED